jgi:flagellar hook-associated protein 3 FlgL
MMRVTFHEQHSGSRALQSAAQELARAQRAVTTGKRVNVASDDPLAARKIVQERAELSALDAYQHSADTAASRLSAADTALTGLIDLYTQALATATAGRGTTATPAAREALAASIRGTRDGVLTQVNAQFAGRPLFAGSASQGRAFDGGPGAWTYQGTADVVQLEVQRDRLVSVTFNGQDVLQGGAAENVLDTLDALASAVETGDDAGVVTGMAAVEAAMARATRTQGRLGADERGISDAVAQLSALRLASETRRSHAEDANLAEAITRLSEADTAYRAVIAAVSREERLSLLDYLR